MTLPTGYLRSSVWVSNILLKCAEIKACKYLLKSLGLKNNVPTLVSCPTCGRTTVNVFQLVRKVDLLLTNICLLYTSPSPRD